MNKYVLLMVIVALMVVITITAQSISYEYSVNIMENSGGQPDAVDVFSIFTMMGTFFKMLFFSLPGVPWWLNLIMYPLTMGLVYMIIDVVKDLVPFT